MATAIGEILDSEMTEAQVISALTEKTVRVPAWGGERGLAREYYPEFHPVNDRAVYPDLREEDGTLRRVTRIALDFQRLAAARMMELVTGVPVKRVYSPDGDRQADAARYIEAVLARNHIDRVNKDRCRRLFACCEVATLWYAVEERNTLYGFDSPLKLRCDTYSPMDGDELWPLFDENGDMIALSVGYSRRVGRKTVRNFDTYTADRHIRWGNGGTGSRWERTLDERTALGKIPGVYMYRPTPIWENLSPTVYDIEWKLSRNGNYIDDNSRPLLSVIADEPLSFGSEPSANKAYKGIYQLPVGSSIQYVTWPQAVENLKFHTDTLRNLFFTQLQLPDWSYEKMSQLAMSGESRKQLFIDAQMKATDESGRLEEFFDRELGVVRAFLKLALGEGWADDLDALQAYSVVTPYTISDRKDTVETLMTANGNLPVMSQRESIEEFGYSDDVDRTMREIAEQQTGDLFA